MVSITLKLGFIIVACLCAFGCNGSVRVYDMSSLEPFSPYMRKEVPLTTRVVVIQRTGEPAPLFAMIPASVEVLRKLNAIPMPTVVLPAGQVVRVTSTKLSNAVTPAGLKLVRLESDVAIHVEDPRFPREIVATFDHSTGTNSGEFSDESFRVFRGSIRPAPWEPSGTPETRTVPWPGDQYLERFSTW
jgi:hypothetical protein